MITSSQIALSSSSRQAALPPIPANTEPLTVNGGAASTTCNTVTFTSDRYTVEPAGMGVELSHSTLAQCQFHASSSLPDGSLSPTPVDTSLQSVPALPYPVGTSEEHETEKESGEPSLQQQDHTEEPSHAKADTHISKKIHNLIGEDQFQKLFTELKKAKNIRRKDTELHCQFGVNSRLIGQWRWELHPNEHRRQTTRKHLPRSTIVELLARARKLDTEYTHDRKAATGSRLSRHTVVFPTWKAGHKRFSHCGVPKKLTPNDGEELNAAITARPKSKVNTSFQKTDSEHNMSTKAVHHRSKKPGNVLEPQDSEKPGQSRSAVYFPSRISAPLP